MRVASIEAGKAGSAIANAASARPKFIGSWSEVPQN